ncbi:hypothetical protein HRI_003352700 [Hibiscus trionum]|uniref:Microspherule protein N-terminal domain-containing protein n=1 Tax=Hibiscus trionum TaxID=183268 RepID=A0A9W7IIP6_HIBTR|nr:hypothetical protein HRI_003352700 [Hibiscus trionum]
MGALAPVVPSWIPEDDLLLKNAMEAGASLESLAKGTVQFSRKFTVIELQSRWDSLLCDPVISEEPASPIIEFEHSASSRAGISNDSKILSVKRKSESVRSCYYASCKKSRNEDLSFQVEPNDSNSVGLEVEALPENPISDHFGVQETNMNVMHCPFPQIQESTHALGEYQLHVESDSGIENLHESMEFPVHSFFEDNDLMVKPSFSFDQNNNDGENICFGFEGNQVLNSPVVEYGLSTWTTDEGLSASAIPTDDGLGKTVLHEVDMYAPPADHVSGHIVGTDSRIEAEIPMVDTEGYLMEITNTLMNDEPFFLDVDAKDVIDKSFFDGLSSLLASSPDNGDLDHMTEAMTIETRDNIAEVSCSGLTESDEVAGAFPVDGPVSCNSEVLNLSSCTLNIEDPEVPCNEDVVFPKQLCRLTVSSIGNKEHGNLLSA